MLMLAGDDLQCFQSRQPFEKFFRKVGDTVAAELQIDQRRQVVQAALLQMRQSIAAHIPAGEKKERGETQSQDLSSTNRSIRLDPATSRPTPRTHYPPLQAQRHVQT